MNRTIAIFAFAAAVTSTAVRPAAARTVGGGALAGIGESTGIDARNGLAIDEATVFAEGAAGGRQGAVAAAGGAATAKAKIAIVLFMLLCSIS